MIHKPVIVLRFVLMLLFCFSVQVMSQNIAIGQWRDHLAYKKGTSVADAGDRVYCVADGNLFSYHKTDHTLEHLSKVAGFSDVGAAVVAYNKQLNAVIIAYSNANIDIIKDNKITNLPEIKNKLITGSKTIHNIFIKDQFAYLSCGFGVVVLDMGKMEIKETYYPGTTAIPVQVFDLTADNDRFYVATSDGLYSALRNNLFLSDYRQWTKDTVLPIAKYNTLALFNNHILINQVVGANENNGRIWQFSFTSQQWSYWDSAIDYRCYKIRAYDQEILIVYDGVTTLYNASHVLLDAKNAYTDKNPRDAVLTDNVFWIADFNNGLVKTEKGFVDAEYLRPAGPASNKVFNITIKNGHLWVAPGDLDGWGKLYNTDGLSNFHNNEWKYIPGNQIFDQTGCSDFIHVNIDPDDPLTVYGSAWGGRGLLKFSGLAIDTLFRETNSSLRPVTGSDNYYIGHSEFDAEKNLWVSNSFVNEGLSVRDHTDNQWVSFTTVGAIGSVKMSKITINSLGQKWVVLPEGSGLLVFDENKTISNKSDDKIRKLLFSPGAGNLQGTEVFVVTEDKNGEMWVGSDKGIVVFYTPSTIFDDSGYDAQQIKIEQGGYVEYLLENETVKCIAIDGANRKWIGTANSGVFLISSDGTRQLEHYTTENSPLLSNTINDIEIEGESGEIFFVTSSGLISHKYTATEGADKFNGVYAYPNPVLPHYNGLIAIKGLVSGCDVKIADIGGSLVYATKALGGQAIWDGRNFNGKKADAGVYIVYCTTPDGSEKATTKIMIIN